MCVLVNDLPVGDQHKLENNKTFILKNAVRLARNWSVYWSVSCTPTLFLVLQVHYMSRLLDVESGTGISMTLCFGSQVISEGRLMLA